jgi:aspartate racemase
LKPETKWLRRLSSPTTSINSRQRAYFENAALHLVDERGAEAIVLGGTDLFLAFGKPGYPYRVVDCALVHAETIARVGMR